MQTNPRPSHKAGRYAMLDLRHTHHPSCTEKDGENGRIGLSPALLAGWTNCFPWYRLNWQLLWIILRTQQLASPRARRIDPEAFPPEQLKQKCLCQNGLAKQARLCSYTKTTNLPEFRDNFPSAESACSIRPVCSYRLRFECQNVQRIEKTSSLKAYWHGNMLS